MATSSQDDPTPPMPHKERGRIGGLKGWVNTDQRGGREKRMAHVRDSSPASDAYWAKNLGFDPDTPLTAEQRRQVATAKKLYFAELRKKSAASIKKKKQEKLRALRERLEAEAAHGGDAA